MTECLGVPTDSLVSKNSRVINAALFGDVGSAGETLEQVYGLERLERVRRRTNLFPEIVTSQNIEACLPNLQDLEVIFATWGMLPLTAAQLDRLPSLKALFYAAGSVRSFARPFLERGILVSSSAAANAVPTAEFTVAQILLANKGYFRNTREFLEKKDSDAAFVGSGNYDATISLLGAGQVGRKVIELLSPFHLRILVFDPFLSVKEARALKVTKVELPDAFAYGDIVSNHLADVQSTCGLLHGTLFSKMKANATFINTGRGRTVNHADIAAVFRARPDLTALLDVTEPEPLPAGDELWTMPNVHISSHIAGSKGSEVGRIADFALEEFERWRHGEPLRYAVKLETLDRGA